MDLALGGHVRAKLLPSRLDPDPAVVRLSGGLTPWCLLSKLSSASPGKTRARTTARTIFKGFDNSK